ncbi:uncharacterized protein BXZ73DRAFT_97889 [Epithele typhae]|uniref:uncharacterized protein n=1 Tax=Epithele typhae TaxID=378194 RepID=UPI002007BEF8|nr:uncharacterized protein BXZ73DRAFT_97889 [Epithele typhae]KAH9942480.1 hypothetical protein BXZ73DRAFT_97889 [Epithele typhae]
MNIPETFFPWNRFPVELQIAVVLNSPDANTFAQLMRVSSAVRDVTEPVFYAILEPADDNAVISLCQSISSTPRDRFSHTRVLHLRNVAAVDDRVLRRLPTLLHSLPNLRALTIEPSRHLLSLNMAGGLFTLEHLVEIGVPPLRAFATTLALYPPALSRLFATCPDLRHLDVGRSQIRTQSVRAADYRKHPVALPRALRSMVCAPAFLQQNADALEDPASTSPELSRLRLVCETGTAVCLQDVMRSLGAQLVSLRLGELGPTTPLVPREEETWTVEDVTRELPQLRFLQLDMIHLRLPYIHDSLVSWNSERPAGSTSSHAGARLAIAWTYVLPSEKKIDREEDMAWEHFLHAAAVDVVQAWPDQVARVFYRHSNTAPYTSITLREDGLTVVSVRIGCFALDVRVF